MKERMERTAKQVNQADGQTHSLFQTSDTIVKEEILQLLNEILRDDMGINIENIGASDLLANYADSDDLSFIFIPEVQARLGVTIPIHKWSEVGSLQEVAQMLEEFTVARNGI